MKQIELLYSWNTHLDINQQISMEGKIYLIITKYWKFGDLCKYEIVEI